MIRLNGVEFICRQGMSLAELVEEYNTAHRRLAFDGFVVIVNDTAITSLQAREMMLNDGDKIVMVPFLDGG